MLSIMEKEKIESLIQNIIGKEATIISPVMGGMMNQSFLIKYNNKEYILYIPTEHANEMVDRKLEKENQSIVSDLGITSKNIYFDIASGIKINEFIKGSSIDKLNTFDYQKVADIFHTLHASTLKAKEAYKPFDRFLNIYEKEADEFIKEREEKYIKLRSFLFSYKEELESHPLVLSHNDAQRSNIVKSEDSKYYFIDFEFVANNDEIYDIACFGNGLVAEGRKLLDAYYINPTKEQIKTFYLWRIFISLQWYNVAISKHYHGEGEVTGYDFLAVAKHFLDNATNAFNNLLIEVENIK